MKKRKIAVIIISAFLVLLFIAFPMKKTGFHLNIRGTDFAEGDYYLYYTTVDNPKWSGDKCLYGIHTDNSVDFAFDNSLSGKIQEIRIDFPEVDNLYKITAIEVSSGGIIKKNYNPCNIISTEAIPASHSIGGISALALSQTTFIRTQGSDPYIVLSLRNSQDIASHYSRFRLSRLIACLLTAVGCFCYIKEPFGKFTTTPDSQLSSSEE